MKVRGRRECQDCETVWSYYETGSVTCPSCGSIDSVGVDDRALHTATTAELDLDPVLAAVDEEPLSDLAVSAAERCRSYVRRVGFVRGGELEPLDDRTVSARELAEAADVVDRARSASEAEELYLLSLLRAAADGERVPAEDVPASMRAARGLSVADAVRDYTRDVRRWLEENPDAAARPVLDRLDEHVRRVRALGGDVDPATADRLLAATRDLGAALRSTDEGALARARDRLDRLA